MIEVIVVMTVLGILAAVAIPRYISVQRDTADAAAKAVAGAITSATALHYGKYVAAGNSGTQVGNGFGCSALADFLSHPLDVGLSLGGGSVSGCAGGGSVSSACAVEHSRGSTGGFAVLVVCTN